MPKKRIIALLIALVMVGFLNIGLTSYMTQLAEADEKIIYTVSIMEMNEYGYVPKTRLEISKPTLEAYVKLCSWKASWLKNGDLLIDIDADGESWIVTLRGDDPEIESIRDTVTKYGLKCSIPDR